MCAFSTWLSAITRGALLRRSKAKCELICSAADKRVEHQERMIVGRIAEDLVLAVKPKSGAYY
jgi:hypothetical protein